MCVQCECHRAKHAHKSQNRFWHYTQLKTVNENYRFCFLGQGVVRTMIQKKPLKRLPQLVVDAHRPQADAMAATRVDVRTMWLFCDLELFLDI